MSSWSGGLISEEARTEGVGKDWFSITRRIFLPHTIFHHRLTLFSIQWTSNTIFHHRLILFSIQWTSNNIFHPGMLSTIFHHSVDISPFVFYSVPPFFITSSPIISLRQSVQVHPMHYFFRQYSIRRKSKKNEKYDEDSSVAQVVEPGRWMRCTERPHI